jgi:hypothetical protein
MKSERSKISHLGTFKISCTFPPVIFLAMDPGWKNPDPRWDIHPGSATLEKRNSHLTVPCNQPSKEGDDIVPLLYSEIDTKLLSIHTFALLTFPFLSYVSSIPQAELFTFMRI